MKSNTALRWKLGLFVTCGLILLVLGLFYVGKQKNLFEAGFQLNAVFKNVSGLKTGNNVRFGGINIGTVERIELITDTSVKVTMTIKKDIQQFIHQNAIAGIGSEGLMGDRVVTIIPGTVAAPPVKEGEILLTRPPIETDEIMAGLKTSADNAAIITSQLAEVAYKVNNGHGILSRLLSDSSMGNNLNTTVVNLKKGSAGLKDNMEAAKHNFLLRGYFKKKKRAEEKKKEKEEAAARKVDG